MDILIFLLLHWKFARWAGAVHAHNKYVNKHKVFNILEDIQQRTSQQANKADNC